MPVTSRTTSASSSIVNSLGLPMFTGSLDVGVEQRRDAAHLVVDVAERPGLAPGAVHRQRFAVERLHEEVRHDPTVGRSQPRPVRVEDANDRGRQTVEPLVRHRQRLGEPLRFVVDRTRAGGIDVAVVRLGLRVHVRIAVDLAGRRDEEPRVAPTARDRARAGCRASRRRVSRAESRDTRAGSPGWRSAGRRRRGLRSAVRATRRRARTVKPGAIVEMLDVLEPTRRRGCRPRRLRRRARAARRRDASRETRRRRSRRCAPLPPPDRVVFEAARAHRRRNRSHVAACGRIEQIARRRRARCRSVRTRSKSSQRNSSHSVSSTTASAPLAASYASGRSSMPGRRRACSPAAGSYACTIAPSSINERQITSAGESRRSSVSALNVRPHAPMTCAGRARRRRRRAPCRRCARAAHG